MKLNEKQTKNFENNRCMMFHCQCIQGCMCSYEIPQCYYRKHGHHSYGRYSHIHLHLEGEKAALIFADRLLLLGLNKERECREKHRCMYIWGCFCFGVHNIVLYDLKMIYRCMMFHFQCILDCRCSQKIHQCYYRKHWHHSYRR